MLHASVQRFDVMGDRGNILGWDEEVNKALLYKKKISWHPHNSPETIAPFISY
jgi:hypothetical protein